MICNPLCSYLSTTINLNSNILLRDIHSETGAALEPTSDVRLVQTIEQYMGSVARDQGYIIRYGEVLNYVIKITNKEAVSVPGGNSGLKSRRTLFSPLHVIVEVYDQKDFDVKLVNAEDLAIIVAPTAARIIARRRRKNLPFVVLHE